MIGRELVYSRRYDANRVTGGRNGLYIDMVLGKKLSKKLLGFGVFGRLRRLYIDLFISDPGWIVKLYISEDNSTITRRGYLATT